MKRIALAACAAALLAAPLSARAGDKTYCVGGYDGTPRRVVAACQAPAIKAQHKGCWHEHNWVTDGKQCFVCWDECDSSCVWDFLENHPGWSATDPYTCARNLGEQHTGGQIVEHMIAGQIVSEPPPPPPAVLESKLERMSPGPYTAGDKVTLVGAVRDEKGNIRPVPGGSFRIVDEKGQVTEVQGTPQDDGTVVAEVTLPPSAGLEIEFKASPPTLGKGETLKSAASEARQIKVEVCGYRARVVSPNPGDSLVSGQSVLLRAALVDAQTGVPLPATPDGARIEFTVQVEGEAAVKVAADAALQASWTPPASPSARQVRLSAGGLAQGRVVCPSGELAATVSDLGLGFDLGDLPKSCYVGVPCRGTVVFKRPAPGAGRQQVDALLGDPAVQVVQGDTAVEFATLPPRADDKYPFDRVYQHVGQARWTIEVRGPRGSFQMPAHAIDVRPALRLALPDALDFGAVKAGSETLSTCRDLDFGASQAAEEHRWQLQAEGLDGCVAKPVLAFRNAAGQAENRPLDKAIAIDALDPIKRLLNVCLEVPRCDGEAPREASLVVTPLTPEFASQARKVKLKWSVEGRGFFSCQGWWFFPSLGGAFLLFLAVGLVRPVRFPAGATIRVAGSDKGIRTASAVTLRECPGSGAGFYRNARLGVHGDGSVNGRVRGCPVRLAAVRGGGVQLEGPGPVEVQDKRTLKWNPVDDLARGHVPSPSALYRAGGVFFKVEPG